MTGYLLVGLALLVFVQANNVYPQLLLARMFFAVGGAACTTMVTAVLPCIAAPNIAGSESQESPAEAPGHAAAVVSGDGHEVRKSWYRTSGSRLAGIVGCFTGCGALIALLCFLPLPSMFQGSGNSAADALRWTYYIVGIVAFVVCLVCFFGLRRLPGQDKKGWQNLLSSKTHSNQQHLPYWKLFYKSILAASQPDIGLGYAGGLVARASSIGITLFIPLLINHDFISHGLCKIDDSALVRQECREAYLLASKLTGISQLVALLLAPIYGYCSDIKNTLFHIPLLLAALSGIIGYAGLAFAIQSPNPKQPDGSNTIYLWISLIGASQIGAIVCSLGSVSKGISESSTIDPQKPHLHAEEEEEEEIQPLLNDPPSNNNATTTTTTTSESTFVQDLTPLQGSIAGTYSLGGGLGILCLTKLGGALFDSYSVAAPFVILLVFNIFLLGAVLAHGGFLLVKQQQRQRRGEQQRS